jgi:hypothetical protein
MGTQSLMPSSFLLLIINIKINPPAGTSSKSVVKLAGGPVVGGKRPSETVQNDSV